VLEELGKSKLQAGMVDFSPDGGGSRRSRAAPHPVAAGRVQEGRQKTREARHQGELARNRPFGGPRQRRGFFVINSGSSRCRWNRELGGARGALAPAEKARAGGRPPEHVFWRQSRCFRGSGLVAAGKIQIAARGQSRRRQGWCGRRNVNGPRFLDVAKRNGTDDLAAGPEPPLAKQG